MFSELVPQGISVMEAPAYWLLNGLYTVMATSESTGGTFSLVHIAAPPGHGTPYHVHRNDDEAFYVRPVRRRYTPGKKGGVPRASLNAIRRSQQ